MYISIYFIFKRKIIVVEYYIQNMLMNFNYNFKFNQFKYKFSGWFRIIYYSYYINMEVGGILSYYNINNFQFWKYLYIYG